MPYCEGGEVIPMFREGHIREAKLRVHLYLWFNEWKAGDPQKLFPDVPEVHASNATNSFTAISTRILLN